MNTKWLYGISAALMVWVGAWYLIGALVPRWTPAAKHGRRWEVALEGVMWLVCAAAIYEDWWWASVAVLAVVVMNSWPSYLERRMRGGT